MRLLLPCAAKQVKSHADFATGAGEKAHGTLRSSKKINLQLCHLPVEITCFPETVFPSNRVRVSAASIMFKKKGEDRFIFADSNGSPQMKKLHTEHGGMLAFCGVFDGHNGEQAAEFCEKGLLQQISLEIRKGHIEDSHLFTLNSEEISQHNDEMGHSKSICDECFIQAFEETQRRYSSFGKPLSFDEVLSHPSCESLRRKFCWWRSRRAVKVGGTTACTLSIFPAGSEIPNPYVIVANCGDSRLITDDGSGGSCFRQVTQDHRPDSPPERARLKECRQQGKAYVSRMCRQGQLRVFPGGLAVSRSIGDAECSHAVIPTPDIHRLEISCPPGQTSRTQRFLLASDGLWDAMSNEAVGQFAVREQHDESKSDPAQAATRVLEACLQNGGVWDDVTILVVDVTVNSSE